MWFSGVGRKETNGKPSENLDEWAREAHLGGHG
jgi:hypothetical protein